MAARWDFKFQPEFRILRLRCSIIFDLGAVVNLYLFNPKDFKLTQSVVTEQVNLPANIT